MRVTVEIVPHGDESAKRTIATINIANVTELAERSDYSVFGKTEHLGAFRTQVRGHLRSRGWIPLVRRALLALGGAA